MTERCGYTYEARGFPDLGNGCCWRPVWKDHDRCIWHADEPRKPAEELRATAPEQGERLDGAILRESILDDVEWLSGTVLVGADLSSVSADDAALSDADLRTANFDDASLREADFQRANLEDAVLRDADLKGANLTGAKLHEADLTRSYIGYETRLGNTVIYETEFKAADSEADAQAAFDAATWTYRTLQYWCRENGLIDRTQQYFIREKDLRRRFAWRKSDYSHALRAEGSRYLIGYGYRIRGILVASIVVIVLMALVFPFLGDIYETTASGTQIYSLDGPIPEPTLDTAGVFAKSLYLSLVSFTTLGLGDVTPATLAMQILAGVEALFGYVLLALLISVLARRRYWL